MAAGAAKSGRIVADRLGRTARPQILHLRLAGRKRLRPRADRQHGGLGPCAAHRAGRICPALAAILRAGAAPAAVRGESMSVIKFPQRAPRRDGWRPEELRQLAALFETNPWGVGA